MNKTPISILQEIMVQRKEAMPDYDYLDSDKPQFPFKCSVKIGNSYFYGYATSKKEAKQNSARAALDKLGMVSHFKIETNNNITISTVSQPTLIIQKTICSPVVNYIGQLNEMASTHGKQYPVYSDSNMSASGLFTSSCTFLDRHTQGFGSNKKIAKQEAAKKMLDIIKKDKGCFDTVIVIKNEKQENIDKLSEEIVKRLEQITLSKGIGGTTITSTEKMQSLPVVMLNVTTLEELREELSKQGYHTKLHTYQEDPYIVSLSVEGTNCVVMGHGTTKEEALNDLFVSMFTMCTYSFSFSQELFK